MRNSSSATAARTKRGTPARELGEKQAVACSSSSGGYYVRNGFVDAAGQFWPPGNGRDRNRVRGGRKDRHVGEPSLCIPR